MQWIYVATAVPHSCGGLALYGLRRRSSRRARFSASGSELEEAIAKVPCRRSARCAVSSVGVNIGDLCHIEPLGAMNTTGGYGQHDASLVDGALAWARSQPGTRQALRSHVQRTKTTSAKRKTESACQSGSRILTPHQVSKRHCQRDRSPVETQPTRTCSIARAVAAKKSAAFTACAPVSLNSTP
jgi:hypothetical protein